MLVRYANNVFIGMDREETSPKSQLCFNLSSQSRFLLAAILILLLFGLTAHVLPLSSCECPTALQEKSDTSDADFCLICHLQTGTHKPQFPTTLNRDITLHISGEYTLNSLEFIFRVLRPPIA